VVIVVVEGLVSSSGPESYSSGSRRSEIPRRREFDKKISSDAESSVISNDLKSRANGA
jgi:hypothetical protein